ncbi:MAG TPA: hypothetical protein DCP98_09440 [Sphaerochaeta sp.]|jgi:hypothetical protein|nr:hypothetical protein [Sphaerochaeta sp.]
MVQFYLLSIVYLVISAGLLLVDKYGTEMLFLINLKTFYNSKKSIQLTYITIGFLTALGLVLFPIEPGPMVIGDILPAANIVVVLIFLIKNFGKAEDVVEFNNEKRNALGFITLGVALVHFVFPWIVII